MDVNKRANNGALFNAIYQGYGEDSRDEIAIGGSVAKRSRPPEHPDIQLDATFRSRSTSTLREVAQCDPDRAPPAWRSTAIDTDARQ